MCSSNLETSAYGSTEVIDLDIRSGCDFDDDGYDDIQVCVSINPASLSSTESEDLIGVAFDLFGNYCGPIPPNQVAIRDVAILGPDTPPLPDPHKWVGVNEVCSYPWCGTKPDFLVQGQQVPVPFDAAIKFNSGPSDNYRVHEACFLISARGYDMPLSALGPDFYARVYSTNDSTDVSKMIGTVDCGLPPPPENCDESMYCDDSNKCTTDVWNPATGKCDYTPTVACPAGESCDPATGTCLSDEQ